MSDEAGLSLIARQQRELLSEIGAIRDNVAVTTAIARRIDGTVSEIPRRADTPAN
jgi:hypothetical protein